MSRTTMATWSMRLTPGVGTAGTPFKHLRIHHRVHRGHGGHGDRTRERIIERSVDGTSSRFPTSAVMGVILATSSQFLYIRLCVLCVLCGEYLYCVTARHAPAP